MTLHIYLKCSDLGSNVAIKTAELQYSSSQLYCGETLLCVNMEYYITEHEGTCAFCVT